MEEESRNFWIIWISPVFPSRKTRKAEIVLISTKVVRDAIFYIGNGKF